MALAVQKARVTRAISLLQKLLSDEQHVFSDDPPTQGTEELSDRQNRRQIRLKQQIARLVNGIASLESSLENLQQAHQGLHDQAKEKETDDVHEYISSADAILMLAESRKVELKDAALENDLLLQQLREKCNRYPAQSPLEEASTYLLQSGQSSQEEKRLSIPITHPPYNIGMSLPTLQVPTFSGNCWEWDNFWQLFKLNIHDQPILKMLKFNYLLKSLQGPAKEAVARFQVTESNYDEAIDWLCKRYGNNQNIIDQLYKRLENMRSEGASTAQQRELLDQVATTVAQLTTKGEDMNHRQVLILILRKFSDEIQMKVLEKKSELDMQERPWDWKQLYTAIDNIISRKERIEECQASIFEMKSKHNNPTFIPRSFKSKGCLYCKRTNHKSIECRTVPLQERPAFFNRSGLCRNCAQPNHRVEECRSNGCKICGQKHHTSLHDVHRNDHGLLKGMNTRSQNNQAPQIHRRPTHQNSPQRGVSENLRSGHNKQILHVKKSTEEKTQLLTGTARVVAPFKTKHATILLDTGSELSFIDAALVEELQLPCIGKESLRISTFGSAKSTERVYDIILVNLKDTNDQLREFKLFKSDIITSNSTTLCHSKEDQKFIQQLDIKLPVHEVPDNGTPRILLGCDQLWNIMGSEIIRLPSGLHLIATSFGYMTSGRRAMKPAKNPQILTTSIEDEETKKWEQYLTFESNGVNEFSGPQHLEKQRANEEVLKRFNDSILKKSDGYYVRLPWKDGHAFLPDNRSIAETRLRGLFRTHRRDHEFLQDYDRIFKDQISKGVLEEVDATSAPGNVIHYLAHHAVVTPEKKTTPKRIVFDASAHYRDRPSLNEVLHKGPLILPSLAGMIMRMRTGRIALISDVEKAFLQVRLQECDRDATRCLWVRDVSREPTEDNLVVYRFTRVTFGLNASPFLLAATIRYHLNSIKEDPELTDEINNNLYVDNLFLRAESTQEGLEKYHKAKSIFNELNMNLREFMSNDPRLNAQLRNNDKSVDENPKVMGIRWNTNTDTLIATNYQYNVKKLTKREILSALASVYDPMGWLAPLMLRTKQFFQYLWLRGYDWEAELCAEDALKWNSIKNETSGFTKPIPRRIANKAKNHSLVVFSDASASAMCAVAYLCYDDESNIVVAKTRLPKLRENQTIPKLEMNACTMAVRLARTTFEELKQTIKIDSIIVLTDSEIVLKWIRSSTSKNLGNLVSNRIREMRAVAEELEKYAIKLRFGYINTHSNPADIGTRGITAQDFQDSMWWRGPTLIRKPTYEWPDENKLFNLEEQTLNIHLVEHHEALIEEKRFSSLEKLERTVAYVLRFIANTSRNLLESTRKRIEQSIPEIVAQEGTEILNARNLEQAKTFIVKIHQAAFKGNILNAANNKLNIKKDNYGIYRCYGRLGNSELKASTQYPIILAPNTTLANLVIRKAHGPYHCAVSHTMANVREQYWIPCLRRQVKAFVRECIPCKRFNGLPYRYPETTNLPSRRVVEARPFLHVGMDMFGPLHLKENETGEEKCYGVIFTCAVTRMIHLELLLEADTNSVIDAVRRFIARRGSPASITCDNAASFKLSSEIFTQSLQTAKEVKELQDFLAIQDIHWFFNTPYAPWKGGFYERLIQSVKLAIHKAVGRRKLKFEAMLTMICEIEACLNSRPLTYIESDFEELSTIRPIDFVQKGMQISHPLDPLNPDQRQDEDYHPPEELTLLRTRSQAIEALESSYSLTRKFWKIWKKNYLTSLREHHQRMFKQGRSTPISPAIGQVVIIMDTDLPRNVWHLGKITRIISPSEVELRSVKGRQIRRPINLLIPLELNQANSSNATNLTSDQPMKPDSNYNLRKRRNANIEEGERSANLIAEQHHTSVNTDATLILSYSPILPYSPPTLLPYPTPQSSPTPHPPFQNPAILNNLHRQPLSHSTSVTSHNAKGIQGNGNVVKRKQCFKNRNFKKITRSISCSWLTKTTKTTTSSTYENAKRQLEPSTSRSVMTLHDKRKNHRSLS